MEPLSHTGAVLDANVLIPAALRDTLLRAAQRGLYRPCWSAAILAEVERNLVRARLTSATQARSLVRALYTAFPRALVAGYERLIPGVTNHPKDRHVPAAAVAARAPVIVTSNLRDFPDEAVAPYGVEPVHPDLFLAELADRAPEMMAQAIERQAAALRNPPKTYDDILDNLTGQAPRFAALMREYRP